MSESLRNAALKKCLVKIRSGSHLYGTNVPSSDEDFVGVFIPPIEYILGLKTVEEIDFSIYSKDASGKNNSDAVDFKMYELRKFVRLALQNNPNIVELLFCNEENIIESSDEWKLLQENKSLFLHKGLKERFIGYAISQRHKMVIKGTNYKDLLEAYRELERRPDKSVMAEVYNDFLKVEEDGSERLLFTKNDTGCHIHVGDICFEPGVYIKKARDKIKERLDKAGNRTELLLKYGHDTKFASHLIRLMLEGIELLGTGDLKFPLSYRDILLEIRSGKWEIQKVLDESKVLEDRMVESFNKTSLPSHPKEKVIEDIVIEILRKNLD
jgi:hypothetical protein